MKGYQKEERRRERKSGWREKKQEIKYNRNHSEEMDLTVQLHAVPKRPVSAQAFPTGVYKRYKVFQPLAASYHFVKRRAAPQRVTGPPPGAVPLARGRCQRVPGPRRQRARVKAPRRGARPPAPAARPFAPPLTR